MTDWKKRFKYNPTKILEKSDDIAVQYSYENDILGRSNIKLADVWESKQAQAILKKQRSDGAWKYKASRSASWSLMDYDQYETAKRLAELVEMYRFDRCHPCIQKISEYFFNHQTPKGDIRGIYANQYSPNYTAMILELLIKAGYQSNSSLVKAMDWLLDNMQQDGGWALAFRTKSYNLSAFDLENTIEADYAKPSSAMVTGVVLRAMAVHPRYCELDEIRQSARFLADSMFTAEKYPDRKSKGYWTRFGFPFMYTDILSTLDSLSLMGGFEHHPKVLEAMEWLEDRQNSQGAFDIKTTRGNKIKQEEWITLAVCRAYKRLFS